MTKEELLNKRSEFTMKRLRQFVEDNKEMSDDVPIVIERIQDWYFKDKTLQDGTKISGWEVLKVEGYCYHSALSFNKNMDEEILRRKNGEEWEYPKIENPLKFKYNKKALEKLKEEFYRGFCISVDNKKEIIYIYSHY